MIRPWACSRGASRGQGKGSPSWNFSGQRTNKEMGGQSSRSEGLAFHGWVNRNDSHTSLGTWGAVKTKGNHHKRGGKKKGLEFRSNSRKQDTGSNWNRGKLGVRVYSGKDVLVVAGQKIHSSSIMRTGEEARLEVSTVQHATSVGF